MAEYQNCPKCGTRNFADDSQCGICKTKLKGYTPKPEQQKEKMYNYKPLMLIGLIVLAFYFFILNDADPNSLTNQKKKAVQQVEENPALQLSILNDQSVTPRDFTLKLFDELLTSLSNQYVNYTKQQIANVLVKGHDIVISSGKEVTHLELTVAFEAFSKELDSQLKIEIEQTVALFLKMVYKV